MGPRELISSGKYVGNRLLFPKRSIQQLLASLHADEELLKVASCNSGTKAGAFAITNKRIIFSHKSIFASQINEYKMGMITSVKMESGMTNFLKIKISSNELVISALDKDVAEELVEMLNSRKKGRKRK